MENKKKIEDFEVEVKTKKVKAKVKKEGEKVDVEVHKTPEEKHFKLDGRKLDVEVKKTAEGTQVNVESENNFLRKVGKYIGNIIAKRFKKK